MKYIVFAIVVELVWVVFLVADEFNSLRDRITRLEQIVGERPQQFEIPPPVVSPK